MGRNSILLYSCIMPEKVNFRPPPVLILVLGSLALWHNNTGLRESKRGTSGIQGADTSSGLVGIGSGRADTSNARRQGWSGPVGCCSGVGRNSILLQQLYSSCIGPVTMETRCLHKKFQRYPPKYFCTARYEQRCSKKKFTFQKPRKKSCYDY